jgi:8-oxo-dGTP pyrophosphatase MutT (NUDIX family)
MKRTAMAVFRNTPRPIRRLAIRAVSPTYSSGAVLALIRSTDGALLLVQQRHTGGWALPGGLMNRGEPPNLTVAREVYEEVGLRLDPAALPVPFAVVSPRVRRIDVVFVCSAGPEVVAQRGNDQDEVLDVAWFTTDALPDVTEPTLDILAGARLL